MNKTKGILLGMLLMGYAFAQGQNCPDCRFSAYVFDSVTTNTVQFGAGPDPDGNPMDLFMDIYEPYGDTTSNRPVIVFAFGGGFIQGNRQEDYVVSSCKRFAQAGYATAAIDYRTGFSFAGLYPNPAEELMRVFFRAMQDMRGSIQWFRAHADQMSNTLRIDPDRIIIGGASSGAITACHVAYCDDAVEFGEIGDTAAIAQLGGFYSSTGLFPSYSWEPVMVFNIAGAVVNVDWMEAGDPPIFSAHGDQDGTVPYQGGNLDLGFSSVGLEGSYNIDQRADSLGICSFLFTMVGEDHPSGGADKDYYDEIFNRALPRMRAVMEGRSFCCPLDVAISPAGTTQVQPNTLLQLSAGVTGDNGNASLRWCEEYCGISQIGAALNGIPGSLPTYFTAMATEGNCLATDFVRVEQAAVQSVAQKEDLQIQIFPNPTAEELLIRRKAGTPVRLEIIGMDGKVVVVQLLHGTESRIDVRKIPAGHYIFRVLNGKSQVAKKILLEK